MYSWYIKGCVIFENLLRCCYFRDVKKSKNFRKKYQQWLFLEYFVCISKILVHNSERCDLTEGYRVPLYKLKFNQKSWNQKIKGSDQIESRERIQKSRSEVPSLIFIKSLQVRSKIFYVFQYQKQDSETFFTLFLRLCIPFGFWLKIEALTELSAT